MVKIAVRLLGISVFLAAFIASVWMNHWFFSYMAWLETAQIQLRLNRSSGDIELLVPYSKTPYTFSHVCRPEQYL